MIGDNVTIAVYENRAQRIFEGKIVEEVVRKRRITHYIIEDKNGNRYIKSAGQV